MLRIIRRFAPLLAVLLPAVLFFYVRSLPSRPVVTTSYVKPQAWSATAAAQRFVFGPPAQKKVRSKMALNWPYTNSDAGEVAARGTYAYVGLDGEGVAYGSNGTYFLRYNEIGLWRIATDMTGSPTTLYSVSAGPETIPLTGWYSDGATEPAPTWTSGTPPTAPGVPAISEIGRVSVLVEMPNLPGDADSMNLERSPAGAGTWTEVGTLLGDSEQIRVRGLTASTAYDFRAVSVNTSGETAGASDDITTLAPRRLGAMLTYY